MPSARIACGEPRARGQPRGIDEAIERAHDARAQRTADRRGPSNSAMTSKRARSCCSNSPAARIGRGVRVEIGRQVAELAAARRTASRGAPAADGRRERRRPRFGAAALLAARRGLRQQHERRHRRRCRSATPSRNRSRSAGRSCQSARRCRRNSSCDSAAPLLGIDAQDLLVRLRRGVEIAVAARAAPASSKRSAPFAGLRASAASSVARACRCAAGRVRAAPCGRRRPARRGRAPVARDAASSASRPRPCGCQRERQVVPARRVRRRRRRSHVAPTLRRRRLRPDRQFAPRQIRRDLGRPRRELRGFLQRVDRGLAATDRLAAPAPGSTRRPATPGSSRVDARMRSDGFGECLPAWNSTTPE